MKHLERLQEDVKTLLIERLGDYVRRVAEDLEYLAGCDPVKLEDGKTQRVGLELNLQEPRILDQLNLADYLIHDAREEQRVLLTDKGDQLYHRLKEEGIYRY